MAVYDLIAFDLDGTLAPIGKGISQENLLRLREIEERGARVAICSGKSEYYLCGLMRQLELKHPVIVGENGAVVRFGIGLPPERFRVQKYSEDAKKSIRLLRAAIEKRLPDMYFQPNIAGLTPFPANEDEFDIIAAIIEEHRPEMKDVIVYRHADSFDITPEQINKYSGMQLLAEMCGTVRERVIAVGDGVNDYPMFEFAGLSLGIRMPEGATDLNFRTVDEALEYILRII